MFAKITLVLIPILQALTLAMTIISFTIYPVYAQTSGGSNMSSSMIESARMHIRAADKALASGNATGALDQVNFAQMQLSMMGMKNMGTMNEQQVKEFMKGGGSGNSSTSSLGGGASASNMDSLPQDCLFGDDGMLQCRFPR
jgi:ABC-type transporter MlaC component